MTKWATKVNGRLDGLEEGLAKMQREQPKRRRGWRREMRDALQNATRKRVTIRYESITASQPVWHRVTHVMPASYATGGDPVDIEGLVPTFLDAVIPPVQGYTFDYDAGADKVLAYIAPGTEAGPGLDLSFITLAINVQGTRPAALPGYVSRGGERLTGAWLRVTQGVAADATDYWELELRAKRIGQTFGETVSRRTTSVAGIGDGEELNMLPSGDAVTLNEGTLVLLQATAQTANTAGFGEVFLDIEVQREVL